MGAGESISSQPPSDEQTNTSNKCPMHNDKKDNHLKSCPVPAEKTENYPRECPMHQENQPIPSECPMRSNNDDVNPANMVYVIFIAIFSVIFLLIQFKILIFMHCFYNIR